MSDGKTIIRSKRPLVYYVGDDIAISGRLFSIGLSNGALGFFIRLWGDEIKARGGMHANEFLANWLELHFHRLAHRKLVDLPEGSYEPGEASSVYVYVLAEFEPFKSYADMRVALEHEEREELAIARDRISSKSSTET